MPPGWPPLCATSPTTSTRSSRLPVRHRRYRRAAAIPDGMTTSAADAARADSHGSRQDSILAGSGAAVAPLCAGGHVGGEDVVGVAVEVFAGPVVSHGGAGVGVAGGDLYVTQVNSGVETAWWSRTCAGACAGACVGGGPRPWWPEAAVVGWRRGGPSGRHGS
jgi:hypothetical protein